MRRPLLFLLLACLAALPMPTAAQQADGVRVRLRPRESGSPWVEGRMQPLVADSVAIRLAGGSQVIHLLPREARLERAAGRNVRGGAARGALIGAALMIAVPALASDGSPYEGLGVLLVPVFALSGGAVGAAVGAVVAPQRWAPVNTEAPSCSRWVFPTGSPVTLERGNRILRGRVGRHTVDSLTVLDAASDSVLLSLPLATDTASHGWQFVVDGARNRRRWATIGAATLGGIAVIGLASDGVNDVIEFTSGVAGNGLIGAGLGAWWAPIRRHPVALACPAT